MNPPEDQRVGRLGSIGPAILIAAVVLGPGSILANSKVGWQYGYDMVWVLVGASLLLIGMTALSARLGVFLDGTICEELARRAGRPLAALTGVSLFLVAACFQFGNNLGVLYAIEPLLDGSDFEDSRVLSAVVLVALNGGIVVALFGFRRLYLPIERLVKILVGVMLIGFAANLILARPSIASILGGLWPRGPQRAIETSVVAVIATTFSVGGAFYQSYLVRQKGWTRDHLKIGLVDSFAGIGTLGLMSVMIMVTAAAVLHGNDAVQKLTSAADVARQLDPLFGVWSTGLFCMGIFAAALSSFLVNAMIGGTVLSDGLGLGGSMDERWPKIFTVLALMTGMIVALGVKMAEFNTGNLIIVAQAITVLGNPLLAGAMLWLACRSDMKSQRAVPLWMKIVAGAGFLVVLVLSASTARNVYLKIVAV